MLNKELQWVFVAATLPPLSSDETVKNATSHIHKLVPDIEYCSEESLNLPAPPANLVHSLINVYNEAEMAPTTKQQLDEEFEVKFRLFVEAIKLYMDSIKPPDSPTQWLVFCNEKDTVEFLVKQVTLWSEQEGINLQLAGLHKNLPEDVKSNLIARFAAGKAFSASSNSPDSKLQILVATDLVSRGLDFPHVTKVERRERVVLAKENVSRLLDLKIL
ncbi:hypothetical protein BCR33DRAFT_713504, partial [Rhizoclosmatium globosum]